MRRRVRLTSTVALVGMVLLLVSCGTGGLPHTNQVTASITPSQATVAQGDSLLLIGNAVGFTASPIVRWWIQESRDIDRYDDCGLLSSQAPPQSGCPYGYVIFNDVTTFPSAATYYAPLTPGTYHVTFEALQVVEFDSLRKTVQATITVQ
jgi:hypothetical protein